MDDTTDSGSGYLRPYHTLDPDGVVIETRMLTDAQADADGLLRQDGEPRVPKKVSRRGARKRTEPAADTNGSPPAEQ